MPHESSVARTPWACHEDEPTAAQAPQAKREGASRALVRRTTERRGRAINQQATCDGGHATALHAGCRLGEVSRGFRGVKGEFPEYHFDSKLFTI